MSRRLWFFDTGHPFFPSAICYCPSLWEPTNLQATSKNGNNTSLVANGMKLNKLAVLTFSFVEI